MKLKHFIVTRFLSTDFGCYGDMLFDPAFIHYNATLLKNNFFKTLENQSTHNFEVIIIIHDDIQLDLLKEIQHIETPLKYTLVRKSDLAGFLNDYDFSGYEYCILSKLDDDDFIKYNVVEQTQKKCRDVDYIHVFGYNHGYAAFEDSKRIVEFQSRFKTGHFSAMQSFIFNLKTTSKIFSPYEAKHTDVFPLIKQYCAENGITFDEHKMISWGEERSFIWYRHKNTGTDKKGTIPVINPRFLNGPDVKIDKKLYGWN